MSEVFTRDFQDVSAKENQKLAERRLKAAREYGVAVAVKEGKTLGKVEELSPAQQKYQAILAQPVVSEKPTTETRGTIGLAFSGGGIRSASFNFGLVQGLARFGALPWVDYLSSVSGGGFTAGCLTTLLSFDKKDEKGTHEYYPFNTQWDYFPLNPALKAFDSDGAAHQREATTEEKMLKIGPPLAKGNNTQLTYLRNKGNYLVPRLGWLGRDFMRGIGSVLIRMSYTIFVFMVALFTLSSLVYGLATALTPRILESIEVPTREEVDADGKTSRVTDTVRLLYLIFGTLNPEENAGMASPAPGRLPWQEYGRTAAAGFLLSILTGLALSRFYLEDPTRRKRLLPWKSPQAGVSTQVYLKMAVLRHSALAVILALSGASAWLWWSNSHFASQASSFASIFYWAWMILGFAFVLRAFWLVFWQFNDFRWVSQGLDEAERFDNLVISTVSWIGLWLMTLWVAWLRFRSFESPDADQAIYWIWLPLVFLFGTLLGMVVYRLIQLPHRVALAREGELYEASLNPLQRGYYDWILLPDQAYRDHVKEALQAARETTASKPKQRPDESFTQSIWAGSPYRSIVDTLQGLTIYGLVAFLALGLLILPHYFKVVQAAGGANAIPLATALISAAWASFLASANQSKDSPSGSLLSKIFTLPERLRNYALGLLVLILVLSLVFVFHTWLEGQGAYGVLLLAGFAAAMILASGKLVDFNYLTPHYFFRDRMADVFLMTQVESEPGSKPGSGSISTVRDDRNERISWITPRDCSAPYHLVQTTLNLPGSWQLRLKDRKSQSFILSKNYCGSQITGYAASNRYRGGVNHYAQAIALSGAAVSSGLGYHTFFAQAFVTTLFNIRLGQWMTNPAEYDEDKLKRRPRPHRQAERPFWPAYLWDEASAQISERKALVNLTDGEHCGDNNGLYPLFQRRCKFIIAGDAGQDPEGRCDSLFQVLRLVKMDFGVEVEINIQGLKPARYDREKKEAEASARHFAVGKISYPPLPLSDGSESPAEQGWLIYFKPAVTKDDPASILNYWEKRKLDFPHPSTADQFFDEEQFEVQRHLGEWTITHTLQSLQKHYEAKIKALTDEAKTTNFSGESWKLEKRKNLVKKLVEQGKFDLETLFSEAGMLDEFMEALVEITTAEDAADQAEKS